MIPTIQNAGMAAGLAGTGAVAGNGDSKSQLFMKLLVAQIQHQDPLAPMESKDFVQQFAAMTQVESLENVASMSSAATAVQESLLIVGLGAQVGAQISVASSSVKLAGQPVVAGFALDAGVSDASAVLTGSDGVEHRIALGPQQAGAVEFGIDPRKLGLPDGTYTLAVQTSAGGKIAPEVHGRLLSVRMDKSGAVMLNVEGAGEVATSGIVRFLGRSSAASSTNY